MAPDREQPATHKRGRNNMTYLNDTLFAFGYSAYAVAFVASIPALLPIGAVALAAAYTLHLIRRLLS